MEYVFNIGTGPGLDDSEVINMLKTPGVVTKKMLHQWTLDLIVNEDDPASTLGEWKG